MILENICRSVINIAKVTGDFAYNEIDGLTSDQIKYKGDRDLVTHIDQTCEKRIVSALSKLLPEAGFVTEEDAVKNAIKEWTWIVDPLDGTTNFVHKVPFFSVSIALMVHDRVVVGVVYNPGMDECFHSYEGGCVFLNNKPVKVSATRSLSDAMIATGFPCDTVPDIDRYMELLKVYLTHAQGVRRFGSAALDLAYVACGRFDAFYEVGLNPWDVAAGAFLVKQAGGEVTDFTGGMGYLFGKEMLACNKALFPRFFDLTNAYLVGNKML